MITQITHWWKQRKRNRHLGPFPLTPVALAKDFIASASSSNAAMVMGLKAPTPEPWMA